MKITYGTGVRLSFGFTWKRFLLFGLGISVIFMLFGAGMLYWDYYRTHYWSDVPAVITFSEVSSYRNGSKMEYAPEIRYTYVVDGQDYHGHVNVSTRSWSTASDEAVARYPVAKQTTVKVNPEVPEDSYLPIEDYFLFLYFLVFGALMVSIILPVGIHGLRKQRKMATVTPP